MKKLIKMYNEKYGDTLGVIDDDFNKEQMYRIYYFIKNNCDDEDIQNRIKMIHLDKPKTLEQQLAKLEAEHNKIDINDVKNNVIFVSQYIKDYSIDNTINLQKMFDDNKNVNNLKVIFDIPSIKLTKPIKCDRGNIDIDFNYTDIQFKNEANITNYGEGIRGIFAFRGKRKDLIKNITNYEFGIKSNDSTSSFDKITLDDVSGLNVKDYLVISIGTNSNDGSATSNLSPHQYRLVQITNISEKVVTIDFSNEWEELGTNLTSSELHTVQVVQPLTNITIEKFKYVDNSNISTKDLNKIVSGLTFLYCDNVKLTNIHGENITHQVSHFELCRNISVDNCSVNTPKLVDAGCGYGVQAVHSHNISAHNFTGIKERHLIDLTDCDDADISSILSSSNRYGISLHGQYEFNLRVSNCKGFIQLGNSGNEFGNASRNLKINNSTLILQMNYCDKLDILNSQIVCNAGLGVNTTINNSDILFYNNGNYANLENPYKRNESSLRLFINNSNLSFNTKKGESVFFKDYDIVSIKNSNLKSYVEDTPTVSDRLIVVQIKQKLVLDNVVTDSFFRITPNGLNAEYIFKNNTFNIYSGEKGIKINSVVNSNIKVEIANNTYNINEDNSIPFQIDSYNCSNSTILLKVYNNFITDTHTSSVTIDLLKGNKYTKYLFDKNIIPSNCTLNLCGGNIGESLPY